MIWQPWTSKHCHFAQKIARKCVSISFCIEVSSNRENRGVERYETRSLMIKSNMATLLHCCMDIYFDLVTWRIRPIRGRNNVLALFVSLRWDLPHWSKQSRDPRKNKKRKTCYLHLFALFAFSSLRSTAAASPICLSPRFASSTASTASDPAQKGTASQWTIKYHGTERHPWFREKNSHFSVLRKRAESAGIISYP